MKEKKGPQNEGPNRDHAACPAERNSERRIPAAKETRSAGLLKKNEKKKKKKKTTKTKKKDSSPRGETVPGITQSQSGDDQRSVLHLEPPGKKRKK